MAKLALPLALVLVLASACGGETTPSPEPAPERTGPYQIGDHVGDFSGAGLTGTVRLSDLEVTPEKAKATVVELVGDGGDLSTTFEELTSLQDSDGEYDEDLKTELIAKAGQRFGLIASDDLVEAMKTPQALVDWIAAAQGSPRVLMIWASGCDTCKRVYNDKVTEAMAELNAPMLVLASHPYDVTETIAERLEGNGYTWRVLLDQEQKVNALFGAERTPHMVVLDAEGVIRYSGGVDSAPDVPRGDEELKDHLTNAIQAIRAGKDVEVKTSDSIGCPLPKAEAKDS